MKKRLNFKNLAKISGKKSDQTIDVYLEVKPTNLPLTILTFFSEKKLAKCDQKQ